MYLPDGMYHTFSPSGEAIAFRKRSGLSTVLMIAFTNGQKPISIHSHGLIRPCAWISENDLVYKVITSDHGVWLHKYSICQSCSNELCQVNDQSNVAYDKHTGTFSILSAGDVDGCATIDRFEPFSGTIRRDYSYNEMLRKLHVYPAFGHSYSTDGETLAIVAWPFDYLEDDVEADSNNSQWLPILDHPLMQSVTISSQHHGTRQLLTPSQDAKQKKPYRVFLLDLSEGASEVEVTGRSCFPAWLSVGKTLLFDRYINSSHQLLAFDFRKKRVDFIGSSSVAVDPVIHPSGMVIHKYTGNHSPKVDSEIVWHGGFSGQGNNTF